MNCKKCGDDMPDNVNCVDACPGEANMNAYNNKNKQCMQLCGNELVHGYSKVNSICQCKPRKYIKPCTMEDEYERQKCFLKNGDKNHFFYRTIVVLLTSV